MSIIMGKSHKTFYIHTSWESHFIFRYVHIRMLVIFEIWTFCVDHPVWMYECKEFPYKIGLILLNSHHFGSRSHSDHDERDLPSQFCHWRKRSFNNWKSHVRHHLDLARNCWKRLDFRTDPVWSFRRWPIETQDYWPGTVI